MKYVGLHTQIWQNNIKSVVLLILFPAVILVLVWIFLFFILEEPVPQLKFHTVNRSFLHVVPWVSIGVFVWFVIAYFFNTRMIQKATGSVALERRDNMRVYNLVENLCISCGMKMPKINLIEDDSLNAFASGIDASNFTVSLSRGIINKLNDEELEAVIAHELTHIRNRDVRLLIVSIVFVGIFAFLTEALFRSVGFGGGSRGGGKRDGRVILIALLLAAIGYLLSSIFRFALSRKREYLADAGAATLTKNPLALASALEKISQDSRIEAVTRKDVAQLFIDNPGEKEKSKSSFSIRTIFSTHPPIGKRIELLRQF
ncbi:MAG: M48 family metallopeptidase [Bacteroidales bacterium]|nr:M48 family metallopeptidase [Bacteroidales bacterium]